LHTKFVVVAMKIINIMRDHLAFEVLPRPIPDAIAGVNGLCASVSLRAQVSAPRFASGTGTLG
jgi:hypothetical protein